MGYLDVGKDEEVVAAGLNLRPNSRFLAIVASRMPHEIGKAHFEFNVVQRDFLSSKSPGLLIGWHKCGIAFEEVEVVFDEDEARLTDLLMKSLAGRGDCVEN